MLINSKEKVKNNISEFFTKQNKDTLILKETNLILKSPDKDTAPKFTSLKNTSSKTDSKIIDFKKSKNSINNNIPPKPTIIAIMGILIISFVIWGFTYKNSQEVFVGNYKIGAIKDKKITADELKETAIAKIESEIGTNIKVKEDIILKPVRSSKSEIMNTNYILSQISNQFTFELEAASITVNGKEIAIVKNKEEAKKVLDSITSKYILENSKQLSPPKFFENVQINEKFVSKDDILTNESALNFLNKNTDKGKKYQIKSGDTLYKIAIDSKMKLEDLLKANPGINENSPLKIGQEINLIVPTPLLSVITEDEITYTQSIPKKIETVNNDKEYKTYRKVISAGKEGTKEVKSKIIKINGIEDKREVISEKVILEPTVEKIEVGTLNTPPKKAIGKFIYPVSGAKITSGFGLRWNSMHGALDLATKKGTPIKASDGGKITFSGWGNGYGNMIKIDHGNGFVTVYAHNNSNSVSVGQNVAQGEIIGYVGSTGNSTGNHVHFEIIKNGIKQNPLNYLK